MDSSTSFTVRVEAGPVGVSPSGYQDLSGRDFNGEAGALAVNDDWAQTIRRKQLSRPNDPAWLTTIPGIVPTSSTPDEFLNLVPQSGSDAIGSRAGVGSEA